MSHRYATWQLPTLRAKESTVLARLLGDTLQAIGSDSLHGLNVTLPLLALALNKVKHVFAFVLPWLFGEQR